MADARICTVCGAAAPAGRTLCGRCGGPVKDAPAGFADGQSRLVKAAAIGAVVLVGGVALAMLMGGPEATTLTQPQVAVTAPRADDSRTDASPSAQPAPAPVFASAEASREGIASYNGGDVASTVAHFTAAVERDGNNAEALNNLGQALVRTGRAREAIPYFDRAIAIAGGVWAYHFNRARAYGELKEWRQAVIGYTDAAGLFPDDYVTHFNLARARQADGDLTGAIESYGKASELAPGQAEFHLWYGQALEMGGRTKDAVAEYRRFLEMDPQASQAEKVRARLAALGVAPDASS